MKKLLFALISAYTLFAFTLTACAEGWESPDSQSSPTVIMTSTVPVSPKNAVSTTQEDGKREPQLFYLPDCEDVETVPCVTYDEDEWRVVTNYHPYEYLAVSKCAAGEGGGPNLPCVWESKRTDIPAPFLFYTNSFTH